MRLAIALCLLAACRSGDDRRAIVHSLDRGESQGFHAGQLALGDGFVYWVDQPRIEKHGFGKSLLERKPSSGGEVETVAGPGDIYSIAADPSSVYWSDRRGVWARPHGGGEPRKLTAPAMWLELVPGATHLVLRSSTRIAMVPKAGGTVEILWQGARSRHHVAADGVRFLITDPGTASLTAYRPGSPPEVLVDRAPLIGAVAAAGDQIHFSGGRSVTPPLWRVGKDGGAPKQVGNPAWGFGEFVVSNRALYGMIFTDAWRLMKLPLDGGAPSLLDELTDFRGMVTALAADSQHLYFLTDFDLKRVPL